MMIKEMKEKWWSERRGRVRKKGLKKIDRNDRRQWQIDGEEEFPHHHLVKSLHDARHGSHQTGYAFYIWTRRFLLPPS